MGIDITDIFGSKARQERDELAHKLALIKPLIARQEALVASNAYLEEIVARVNRHKDDMLEYGLLQLLERDQSGGSFQINLLAKPLILVVDIGLNSTAIALAQCRLDSDGSPSIQFLTTKVVVFGALLFEQKLTEWVKEQFVECNPNLQEISKSSDCNIHFKLIAKRLLSLLCQNAPQGEMEESITIDSETYRATIKLIRLDIAPLFMPLVGPEGDLIKEIRLIMQNTKLNSDALDRVVCLGMYGRLPLVRDGLSVAFKKPVVFADALLLDVPVGYSAEAKPGQQNSMDLKKSAVSVIGSETYGYSQKTILQQPDKQMKNLIYNDPQTGLMWTRNANLAEKQMTWKDAQNWAKNLKYAGFNDWRLPTREELYNFVKRGGNYPAEWFYNNGFNVCSDSYWSGSMRSDSPNSAWHISLSNGNEYNGDKSCILYVWPVRK